MIALATALAAVQGFSITPAVRPVTAVHRAPVVKFMASDEEEQFTKTSKVAATIGAATILASSLPRTAFVVITAGSLVGARVYWEANKAANLDADGLIVAIPDAFKADPSKTSASLSETDGLPLTSTSKAAVSKLLLLRILFSVLPSLLALPLL